MFPNRRRAEVRGSGPVIRAQKHTKVYTVAARLQLELFWNIALGQIE